MFNAHQYILKEIMEAEDFAAARRIQHERHRTLDQHQRPVFINENAGLAYVTVPRHGQAPRTRLVSVPLPPFQQVRRDANRRSIATFSYEEADRSVSVLTDQILNRRMTINWATGVDRTEDIRTITDDLFHRARYFRTDMIRPATLYNISSDLTDIYSENDRNLTIRTRFTDQRLLH